MGLDMYLYKETYVKQWPHQLEEDAFKITITKNELLKEDTQYTGIYYESSW